MYIATVYYIHIFYFLSQSYMFSFLTHDHYEDKLYIL